MRKKGLAILLGIICLLVILTPLPFMASCAAPTPGQMNIELQTNPIGATGYVFGFAYADFINKGSTWLKATAVETKGSAQNFMVIAQDPAKRKNTVAYGSTYTRYSAEKGEPPFTAPYTGVRWLGKVIVTAEPLVSRDPSIKRYSDLVGKHVGLGMKGASNDISQRALIDAYGITAKVKISSLTFDASKTGFLDGTLDVTYLALIDVGGGKWQPNPATEEILASPKPIYFITADEDKIRQAKEASGLPIFASVVSPRSIVPGQRPPEPILALGVTLGWWVDVEMDKDVAYELSRILWEYADKFRDVHASGLGLSKDIIHMVPGLTEKDLHPGALKFAKKKGLKIGL